VKAAKGPAPRHEVGDIAHACERRRRDFAADDQQVGSDLGQLADLPIENRTAGHHERTVVAAVEARGPSAGQYGAGRKFNVQKSRSNFKVPASTAGLSRYYSVYA
jgi:hypothetical protein